MLNRTITSVCLTAKRKVTCAFAKKEHGDATLVTVLGLILIACVLLYLFRNTIRKVFNNIMGQLEDMLSNLFDGGYTGGTGSAGGATGTTPTPTL